MPTKKSHLTVIGPVDVSPPASSSATPQLVGYAEASRILSLPVGTLYAMVHDGKIPYFRIAERTVRFRLDELERWLEARRAPVAAGATR